MPKTPKFIIDMKSYPRSPKHGNRKPAAQAYGNPIDGAGARDDRADAISYTIYNSIPITRFATISTPPGAAADHLKQMQDMIVQQMQKLMHSIPDWTIIDDFCVKPPEIPHAGIRAGEIIGYRLWWVNHDGRLRSLIQDNTYWEPGEAMTGDINKCIHFSFRGPHRFGGVYAFNYPEAAIDEYKHLVVAIRGSAPGPSIVGLVLGTVKLWGEVVEHEKGYRASFAKPNEFLKTYYWGRSPTRDPYELYFGSRPMLDSAGWTG